jgi:hypothetical protein
MPVVESTAVAVLPAASESESESESKTIVTKLPADPAEPADPAPAAKRRLGLRRRKQPAETGSADPSDA